MRPRSYRDLDVWQKSIDWTGRVYATSSAFPKLEQFGPTAQLRRACLCVPCNIAEGAERRGTREFLQLLGIALGSLAEAETLIILGNRLGYLADDAGSQLLDESATIAMMLHGLRRSLENKPAATARSGAGMDDANGCNG